MLLKLGADVDERTAKHSKASPALPTGLSEANSSDTASLCGHEIEKAWTTASLPCMPTALVNSLDIGASQTKARATHYPPSIWGSLDCLLLMS